jgi:hypothetical protein
MSTDIRSCDFRFLAYYIAVGRPVNWNLPKSDPRGIIYGFETGGDSCSVKTNSALSAKNREAICGRGAAGDMYGQIESV